MMVERRMAFIFFSESCFTTYHDYRHISSGFRTSPRVCISHGASGTLPGTRAQSEADDGGRSMRDLC